MLDDSTRSAGLRRPETGTPASDEDPLESSMPFVADCSLLTLGLRSPSGQELARLLLKVQVRTYGATGHIICYADEFVARAIKRGVSNHRIPMIYCRCMRCGCLALLYSWIAAADRYDRPLQVGRRYNAYIKDPSSTLFCEPCAGDTAARDALEILS
jgi:hypothetical protein